MNAAEKPNALQRVAERIMYNLDHTKDQYSKVAYIRKIVEQLPDEKIFIMDFAFSMTPTAEEKAQAQEEKPDDLWELRNKVVMLEELLADHQNRTEEKINALWSTLDYRTQP